MEYQKKTKIVATIGPSTDSAEMMEKLIEAGLDVIRLNFSHGDIESHTARIRNLAKAVEKTGKTVAIMQDLSGPKIRIGDFSTETVDLVPGEQIILTTKDIKGTKKKVHINYPLFAKEMKVGAPVLLDDGKKRLEVVEVGGEEVTCKIVVGGTTKGRRGVNLPGADLSVSALTEKDKEDVKFGIENKVSYVALSFVRRASDITELRELLTRAGSDAAIIAKIETPEAVKNIDQIIELADGIMVARGDLAIEIPAETVPMIQKMIIKKCNNRGKPVITATQMLESMVESPVPTRAEVSDIANAIIDGTDAIMLSEETTLGKYPLEAVQVMTRVALQIEKESKEHIPAPKYGKADIADAVSGAVVKAAEDVGAEVIFALTESGSTARMISRFRPKQLIIAMTPNQHTLNKLALNFGCLPFLTPRHETLEHSLKLVREYCLKNELVERGDKVIVTAGTPFNEPHTPTNTLMVEVV